MSVFIGSLTIGRVELLKQSTLRMSKRARRRSEWKVVTSHWGARLLREGVGHVCAVLKSVNFRVYMPSALTGKL